MVDARLKSCGKTRPDLYWKVAALRALEEKDDQPENFRRTIEEQLRPGLDLKQPVARWLKDLLDRALAQFEDAETSSVAGGTLWLGTEDLFAQYRSAVSNNREDIVHQLDERLDELLLLRCHATVKEGSRQVSEFLSSPDGSKLKTLAGDQKARWGSAARYVYPKMLSVALPADTLAQRQIQFQQALKIWQTIEERQRLPHPMLLPGIESEASADDIVRDKRWPEAQALVVPVPFRYRSALCVALADIARQRRRMNDMTAWLGKALLEVENAGFLRSSNSLASINLDVCKLMAQGMQVRFEGAKKQPRHEVLNLSEKLIGRLEETFSLNWETNSKYWEWKAVSIAGRLLGTRRNEKRARQQLFDTLAQSVDKMLELRRNNAPFIAIDAAYSLAFTEMGAQQDFAKLLNRIRGGWP